MTRRISFIRFCSLLGLSLTAAWVVLLKVCVDGVQPGQLEGEERELARQIYGDVDEVDPGVRRILIWRLGRASGKSTIAAALALYSAMTADLSRAGRGQVPTAFVVSPSKPIAKIALTIARELVRGTPLEHAVIDKADTAESFLMQRDDGRTVAIRCVAASKGGANLRGVDVITLVLDESEFFGSASEGGEGAAVSDRDQIAAVMPRLIEHVVCISTPWPTENATADYFDRNFGRPTDALAVLGSSLVMRPTPELVADIEREQQRDPETASREFFCRPGARGGAHIFVEGLDAALVEGRPPVIFAPSGASIGAGGDLGLERDSSAIAVVANVNGAFELLEFDEVRPGKNEPLSPGYVIRQRFAPVMNRHGVTSVAMDAHYRQAAIEHLNAADLEFERAPEGNQGKYDSYMHVRSLLRTGNLKVPAVPRLIAQLRAVTSTPLPGGGTRITSPRRMGQAHGDIVSALVLACWAAREGIESDWGAAVNAWAASGGRGTDAVGSEKPPLARLHHYTGMCEIYGNPPKFDTRMRVIFIHQNDEGRWSATATPEFKNAVRDYRRANNL